MFLVYMENPLDVKLLSSSVITTQTSLYNAITDIEKILPFTFFMKQLIHHLSRLQVQKLLIGGGAVESTEFR